MPVNHRSGDRAGPHPTTGHRHDEFVAAHPDATAMLVLATGLLALSTPAALVAALLFHLTVLGLTGAGASLLLYGGGYLAAVWHRRDLRRQLDQAHRDPVTGLATRAVAEAALRTATADRTRLTVALADVDGLRAVNNGLGHAAGDQLLHTIAARLAQAVPAGGLLARLGGDEFLLLAPDTDPATLATAIGAALAGPAVIAGHRLQPRASVGIATTDALVDAHYALARADAAMYTAKDAAGNQILLFDPDRDGEPDRDGTRPLVRRRDQRPASTDAITWAAPRRGEQLVPVLWTAADLATIHAAVTAARDRFTDAASQANTGATRPDRPTEPAGPENRDRVIDIEPTRRGYATMAGLFGAEAAKYDRIAQRLGALSTTVADPDDR